MDQWLAQIYGTGASEDIEKTAQHHLLAKLAEEQGVDLSGMDEDQLNAIASEVFGEDGEELQDEGLEEVATEEMLAKEAQAKFEEADFLGRVMAHAYTQELEKIAAIQLGPTGDPGQKGRRVAGFLARAKKRLSPAGDAVKSVAKKVDQKAQNLGTAIERKRMGAKEGPISRRRSRAMGYGASGAAAAAVGGAGYAVKKKMQKEASAFEKLAFEHAQNILGAAEQSLAQQQAMMAQQPDAQFGQALDQRALEILAENGYDVDQITDLLGDQEGGEIETGDEGFYGEQPVGDVQE